MRPTTKESYAKICRFWMKWKGRKAPKEIAKDLGISVQLVYKANEWFKAGGRGTLTGQFRNK